MPPEPCEEFDPGHTTFDELVDLVGEEIAHGMLELGQHYSSDEGLPCWTDEACSEAFEMAKLERDWDLVEGS